MIAALALLVLLPSQQILLADDSMAGMLHREDVQAELKFSKSQKTKWSEIDRLPRSARGSTFDGDPMDILDPDVIERRDTEREAKVWRFLGPDQSVRMLELFVQRNGVRTLLRSDYQKRLALTEDQVDQVRQAKARHDGDLRGLMKKIKGVNTEIGRLDPKKVANVRASIEKTLVEDLDKIATQEQRNQIDTLGGRKFRFLERRFD